LSQATPLAIIKDLPATTAVSSSVSLSDMFFGFTGGVIGETSALAILIGGLYLVIRKVISLRIPLAYLISCGAFMLIFSGRGFDCEYLAAQLIGGGLMLGAWFMATDYVTSPITPWGQIVYGILLGVLTGLIRICSSGAEGVSFTIIFCNLLVPHIEKLTMPKAFGLEKKKKNIKKGA
jgi:Na+-translocating ferredoxin:NAD+ oxidoreductase RnfD subunit